MFMHFEMGSKDILFYLFSKLVQDHKIAFRLKMQTTTYLSNLAGNYPLPKGLTSAHLCNSYEQISMYKSL